MQSRMPMPMPWCMWVSSRSLRKSHQITSPLPHSAFSLLKHLCTHKVVIAAQMIAQPVGTAQPDLLVSEIAGVKVLWVVYVPKP